jgi:hypothetical protein
VQWKSGIGFQVVSQLLFTRAPFFSLPNNREAFPVYISRNTSQAYHPREEIEHDDRPDPECPERGRAFDDDEVSLVVDRVDHEASPDERVEEERELDHDVVCVSCRVEDDERQTFMYICVL